MSMEEELGLIIDSLKRIRLSIVNTIPEPEPDTSIVVDLLAACKLLMELADDGSAAFDDPHDDSPYLIAQAAIEKAEAE